jgi:hypothetical protein
MPKQAPKSKKRGRKEERLVITDPTVLRTTKIAAEKMATLRKDFKKAHGDGMAALKNRDFDAFGDAIKRERNIIETQIEMIERSIGKKSTRQK